MLAAVLSGSQHSRRYCVKRLSRAMKTQDGWPKTNWQPRSGWGVPVAWLTLCIVWSSTWLAIKIWLRDLPPISFVAIRFLIAITALVAVSIGGTRLLRMCRGAYAVLELLVIYM